VQGVDLGVHLPQLALGFLQLVDAVLELGDARGFLIDHRADNRQVVGALLNPVATTLRNCWRVRAICSRVSSIGSLPGWKIARSFM
jgi:hypothetical protein